MKSITVENIIYGEVSGLDNNLPNELPILPDHIYEERLKKVQVKMKEYEMDYIVVYGDKEHFSNFHYLTGFEPRFEEGLLIVHKSGTSYILLGIENYEMYKLSKIEVEPVLYSAFSIPNNVRTFESLEQLLSKVEMKYGNKVGVVGWKLFEEGIGEYSSKMFDIPAFIVSAIGNIVGSDHLINVTPWFSNPKDGLRICNTADEIAFYEYGAAWASEGVKRVIDNLRVGMSELELANYLPHQGLPLSCHPMVSSEFKLD
ncbi:aminopeptidase P family N-terminal domain-containing protein [Bacillus sp. N9]